jgi:hypothetical protein
VKKVVARIRETLLREQKHATKRVPSTSGHRRPGQASMAKVAILTDASFGMSQSCQFRKSEIGPDVMKLLGQTPGKKQIRKKLVAISAWFEPSFARKHFHANPRYNNFFERA